jgi:hypothetical protein
MPYGIHFVAQAENPVGFWLWRIATALQDAEEAAGETANLAIDVETSALHGFAAPLPGVAEHDRALDDNAAGAAWAHSAAGRELAAAQAVAEGKDPHDAATIAELQAIFARVAGEAAAAEGAADASAGQVEDHPF